MAKELVVGKVLSEEMVEAGTKLIERLDQSDSDVQAAIWLFFPKENIWRMLITSPLVKTDGPGSLFERVLKANKGADEFESVISLNNIGLTDIPDLLVNFLKSEFYTENVITGIRISRKTIGGLFIEDVYIYRINIST